MKKKRKEKKKKKKKRNTIRLISWCTLTIISSHPALDTYNDTIDYIFPWVAMQSTGSTI